MEDNFIDFRKNSSRRSFCELTSLNNTSLLPISWMKDISSSMTLEFTSKFGRSTKAAGRQLAKTLELMNFLLVSNYRQITRDNFVLNERANNSISEELSEVSSAEYRNRLSLYEQEVKSLSQKSLEMIGDYKKYSEYLRLHSVPKLKDDDFYDFAIKRIESELEELFKPFEKVNNFQFTPKLFQQPAENKIIQNQLDSIEKEIKQKQEEKKKLRQLVEDQQKQYEAMLGTLEISE